MKSCPSCSVVAIHVSILETIITYYGHVKMCGKINGYLILKKPKFVRNKAKPMETHVSLHSLKYFYNHQCQFINSFPSLSRKDIINYRMAGPTKNVLQRLATQGLMCSLSTSGPYTGGPTLEVPQGDEERERANYNF